MVLRSTRSLVSSLKPLAKILKRGQLFDGIVQAPSKLQACLNPKLQASLIHRSTTRCSNDSFPGTRAKVTSQLHITNPDNNTPVPIYRVLDRDGRLIGSAGCEDQGIPDTTLIKMYKDMTTLEKLDQILEASQRQGRISFYATNYGEEALQVASAAALDDRDLVFGQYREVGVLIWRGLPIEHLVNQCFGNSRDPAKGRQMPVHYGSRAHNFVTIKSVLGTQIPQAPGAAYAFKRKQNGLCVVCYFGEGAASEGDAHAAFNFAAVLECPVIFFCRNNGYAISTPVQEQYKGDGIASRAPGYGMLSIRVDGNDTMAVYQATKEARRRAVEEQRPVLIEAMSYRVGDHSTSDDSKEYRPTSEIKYWNEEENPITRLRKYIMNRSIWDAQKEEEWNKERHEMVMKAFKSAQCHKKANPGEMFEDVYDVVPDFLKVQRDSLQHHVHQYKDHYPIGQFESWTPHT